MSRKYTLLYFKNKYFGVFGNLKFPASSLYSNSRHSNTVLLQAWIQRGSSCSCITAMDFIITWNVFIKTKSISIVLLYSCLNPPTCGLFQIQSLFKYMLLFFSSQFTQVVFRQDHTWSRRIIIKTSFSRFVSCERKYELPWWLYSLRCQV